MDDKKFAINGQPLDYDIDSFYWEICCDCRLSHYVTYSIEKNKVIKRVYRDDWYTQERRKKMSNDELNWLLGILQAEKRRRKKLRATRCTDEEEK